jgi:NAD(P)-dependent dehydrogenase (short-subunit alcohol dehydrogenase family)
MAGKTILVTGSTSAVGRAAVRRLAKAGATVIMSGPEVEKVHSMQNHNLPAKKRQEKVFLTLFFCIISYMFFVES